MGNINEENKDPNFNLRIWTKISDETSVKVQMVRQIHKSILKERKKGVHIDSKNATRFIIQDLINNDNGSIQGILKHNGIKSSEDFGTIVKKLCEEGLIVQEEHDYFEDFNGHFQTESIDDFIKLQKLKKDIDHYKLVCYSFYLLGFALVLVAYLTSIPNKIALYGYGLALLGGLLLTYKNKIIYYLNKKRNHRSA